MMAAAFRLANTSTMTLLSKASRLCVLESRWSSKGAPHLWLTFFFLRESRIPARAIEVLESRHAGALALWLCERESACRFWKRLYAGGA